MAGWKHIRRCTCSNCVAMGTQIESRCCMERPQILTKMEEYRDQTDSALSCMTEHPGFTANCLNQWVLEVAYLQYKQQYKETLELAQNEIYRHTAYWQLVRWCWGIIGRNNRVTLHSCCVSKIRNTFPNVEGVYTGFRMPVL
ncbi:P2X purinoceptor 7-like [Corythoichthys intestinalis]|uniref:P2X purinoceptor 7-like n=1 Tax=Corythoichthys intestinalis TaxID=161448 RepID=UPI0025A5EC99|nr:P2X purinoceptor 7-like [Corythoichthys intestinalis]